MRNEFKHPEKSILGRIERLEAQLEGETKIFFDKESRNRVFDKISLLREVEDEIRNIRDANKKAAPPKDMVEFTHGPAYMRGFIDALNLVLGEGGE